MIKSRNPPFLSIFSSGVLRRPFYVLSLTREHVSDRAEMRVWCRHYKTLQIVWCFSLWIWCLFGINRRPCLGICLWNRRVWKLGSSLFHRGNNLCGNGLCFLDGSFRREKWVHLQLWNMRCVLVEGLGRWDEWSLGLGIVSCFPEDSLLRRV